jgi:hypothetical protein
VQFAVASCHFIPLRARYSLQHPVLPTSSICDLLLCDTGHSSPSNMYVFIVHLTFQ